MTHFCKHSETVLSTSVCAHVTLAVTFLVLVNCPFRTVFSLGNKSCSDKSRENGSPSHCAWWNTFWPLMTMSGALSYRRNWLFIPFFWTFLLLCINCTLLEEIHSRQDPECHHHQPVVTHNTDCHWPCIWLPWNCVFSIAAFAIYLKEIFYNRIQMVYSHFVLLLTFKMLWAGNVNNPNDRTRSKVTSWMLPMHDTEISHLVLFIEMSVSWNFWGYYICHSFPLLC